MIRLEDTEDLGMVIKVDSYDFVIVDLDPAGLPPWVYPFIHGRFVPAIRLWQLDGDTRPDLPPLLRNEMLRGVAPADEPILYWRDSDLLVNAIETQIARMSKYPDEAEGTPVNLAFESLEDGIRYFRRAERRDASIFISNAGEANEFARALAAAMRKDGMKVFQYQEENGIRLGEKWLAALQSEVRASEVFLPLVTKGFWESKACKMELALAKESAATIIPCILDPAAKWAELDTQGIPPPTDRDQRAWIETIVSRIDELLREARQYPRPKDSLPVDVAFVTVLKEEYEAVLRLLTDVRTPEKSVTEGNDWSWQLGEIESPTNGRYRAVLAFAGTAGTTNAVNVTRDTLDRFRPEALLLVGIAGGMPVDALSKGDVVVSKIIWEYEYGKIDAGFTPRVDLMYPSAGRLVRSAEVFPVLQPDWSLIMQRRAPSGEAYRPKVRVGIVGSGNKVIDNIGDAYFREVLAKVPGLAAVEMEGAGVAAAIAEMRSRHDTDFVMIRGISDMPPAEAAPERCGNTSPQTAQRDSWKQFAAEAAACFAVQLVRLGWPAPPRL